MGAAIVTCTCGPLYNAKSYSVVFNIYHSLLFLFIVALFETFISLIFFTFYSRICNY